MLRQGGSYDTSEMLPLGLLRVCRLAKMVRILGLHGWRTSGRVLRTQLSGFVHSLRTEAFSDVDLVCLDAPFPASGPAYPQVESAFGKGPYFEWWDSQETTNAAGKTEIKYAGVEQSTKFVLDYISKHGPFDMVVGFSQGGIFLSLLQAMVDQDPHVLASHRRWKCAVLFAGMQPRDTQLREKYFSNKSFGSRTQVIHVIGEADQMRAASEALAVKYANEKKQYLPPVVVRHSEGHQPPGLRLSSPQLSVLSKEISVALVGKLFFAFDFDGVVCHSAHETGSVGVKAGMVLFPDLFLKELQHQLVDVFVFLRPLLEHGYDAIVLPYIVAREAKKRNGKESLMDIAHSIEPEIRKNGFDGVLMQLKQDHGLTPDSLQKVFHETRAKWIEDDEEGWLDAHKFYEDTVKTLDLLCARGLHVYIVTTKHKTFATRLCAKAQLCIPEHRIFGQGMGSKESVLNNLMQGVEKGSSVFFLEDRVGTLERMVTELEGPSRLGFAAWGYNTEADRAIAESNGFEVFSEQSLQEMIRSYLNSGDSKKRY